MDKSGNQKIKTINLNKAGGSEKEKLDQFIKENKNYTLDDCFQFIYDNEK